MKGKRGRGGTPTATDPPRAAYSATIRVLLTQPGYSGQTRRTSSVPARLGRSIRSWATDKSSQ